MDTGQLCKLGVEVFKWYEPQSKSGHDLSLRQLKPVDLKDSFQNSQSDHKVS